MARPLLIVTALLFGGFPLLGALGSQVAHSEPEVAVATVIVEGMMKSKSGAT